jgi:hypothetical protein
MHSKLPSLSNHAVTSYQTVEDAGIAPLLQERDRRCMDWPFPSRLAARHSRIAAGVVSASYERYLGNARKTRRVRFLVAERTLIDTCDISNR